MIPGRDRLVRLLGRARVEREIDDEFEAHIAHRVDDLVDEGVDPAEARTRAEAEFGDRGRLRRATVSAGVRADRGRNPRAGGLGRDLAWSLRQLRRSPGFTGVAGLTLTLGIGAAVAIVSVVRAVVFDPLPFAEPHRLVVLEARTPADAPFSVSEPAFLEWRERTATLSDVGAWAGRTETLRSPGEPRPLTRAYANAGLLEMLGVSPTLGRPFNEAEDRPGEAAAVALLGHGLWVERFGASPDAVGRTLDVDGRVLEVIGVLPEAAGVLFGADVDVLTPLAADPGMDRGEHYLDVVARLAPGATIDAARAEVKEIAAWQSGAFEEDRGWGAAVEPLDEALLGTSTIRAGWVLLAAAGLLLAMACVNVSNLLLARATARRGELGLRAVLGAGRWALIRQLAVESTVLAAVGWVGGMLFAGAALPLVRRLGEGRIPRLESAGLDPSSAWLACLVAAAAIGLFGLAPAVRLRRRDLGADLRRAGRGGGSAGGRARRVLVAGQVAASVVLLVGTGLLLRSFLSLSHVDPGFEASGTLALSVAMPDAAYSWQERGPLLQEVLREGRAVPGVSALGATSVDPFSGYALANFVAPLDRMPDRAEEFTPIHWRVVTPGFFDAMGMAVRAGRTFADGDDGRDGSPVVIDEGLAERLYGGPSDAVGRWLVWGDPDGSRLRIVGVVERLRDVFLDEAPVAMVFRAHQEIPWASMTLVARVRDGVGAEAAAGLRAAVRGAAPGVAVPEVRSLEANVSRALAEPRFNLLLLAGFAVVGLALAVVGLYGLTAFEVRHRFREIGIRMSLGADAEDLVRSFVGRRLGLTAIGLAVGLVSAWPAARWLEALLFETSAADPLTWLGVVVTVALTAALAAWIPARRASRVDPREVLSVE